MFLKQYYKESADIKQAVCDKFRYFSVETKKVMDEKHKTKNFLGSCMSYICCFIENQCLMLIVDLLKKQGIDISKSILCFDGIMIPKSSYKVELLSEIEEMFASLGIPIKMSRKEMKPIDLTKLGYKEGVRYDYKPIVEEHVSEALSRVSSIVGHKGHDFDIRIPMGDEFLIKRCSASMCSSCGIKHSVDSLVLSFYNTCAKWRCSLAGIKRRERFWSQATLINESLEKAFDNTFTSTSGRIRGAFESLLKNIDVSFDGFREMVCDSDFTIEEDLSFWCDKYCIVKNSISRNEPMDFNKFVRLIKTMKFGSKEIMMRFMGFFINEFMVMGSQGYIRCTVADDDRIDEDDKLVNTCVVDKQHGSIRSYNAMNELKNVIVKFCKSDESVNSRSVDGIMKQLPFHTFDSFCYRWKHDPLNTRSFSLAAPFQAQMLPENVSEDDLDKDLLYYLKTIICDNDAAKWDHIRAWLANICHQPDKRTQIMIVLFSPEKRVGKSTFRALIVALLGLANIKVCNSLKDAFGERGGAHLYGSLVAWFEELSANRSEFRACLDRMKTALTDDRTTHKKLYHEIEEVRQTTNHVAVTNNLIGVLEDRMSVFKMNIERRGDTVFYKKLRSKFVHSEMDKLFTYLEGYTTPLPMTIIKTGEYNRMLTASLEPVCNYIDSFKHRNGF